MTKKVKKRTEELVVENPFLKIIFIEDFEYEFGNLIFFCRYHKNDLKCHNGISSIPTSGRLEMRRLGDFDPSFQITNEKVTFLISFFTSIF